ncbi:toll-like receptor 4 [Lingula anatina]|uniref:Toll-like receptor 4 n=1 Tax=Lingula anatina TaxID=7574 RepID=A0A2R2MT73_LINAN|nr:toll-like receptor 4 [Lingula anatina]|eukprot:XP_023933465.1 toll-like receptor 4 [Lingula anatina]
MAYWLQTFCDCPQPFPFLSSSLNHVRYDAFIAHSSKDKDVVEPVIEQLEERGTQCCYSTRDFDLGKSLTTSIQKAIDESKCTNVFLSENFMKSSWCEWEADRAITNSGYDFYQLTKFHSYLMQIEQYFCNEAICELPGVGKVIKHMA